MASGSSEKPKNVVGKWPKRSVLFHISIGVVFLIVLVLALVALGSLAAKHNEVLDVCPQCGCILYSSREPSGFIRLSSGKSCAFGIWGEAVIAAIAVGFIVLTVVKVVAGKPIVGIITLVELTVIIATVLLGLAIGIVISAGLSQTCDAFDNDGPCSENHFITLNFRVVNLFFYNELYTSEVTAWLGFAILAVVAVAYIVILIYSRVQGKKITCTRGTE